MGVEFCPLEVAWGDVATWAGVGVALLAAIATFAAVIVALKTSNQARQQLKELRDEDARKAEEIRQLRARAYSAAVVDDIQRAVRHVRVARDLTNARDIAEYQRVYAVVGEMSEIDTTFLQRMLEHVEVFGRPGKVLARMTVMLMEVEHTGKRNLKLLERRNAVPDNFMDLLRRKLEKDLLYLRGVAPMFYDLAQIRQESRIIPALTEEESRQLFGEDPEDIGAPGP